MPFLHWFRKKSRSPETLVKDSAVEQFARESHTVTETTSKSSKSVPDSPSGGQSASIAVGSLSAAPAPDRPASATAEPADSPATVEAMDQPLGNTAESREPASAEVPLSASAENAGEMVASPEVEQAPTESGSGSDSEQTGHFEGHPAPTVRATTASGKINLPGGSADTQREIRLRLEPILADLPPGLEQPSIPNLSDTQAEIVLPLGLIESQLAEGRVVVSAAILHDALPNELKPYFATIEPSAEIPIPLREIFLHLPPEIIKLREDQEVDDAASTIQTPFSKQAEEDANRLGKVPNAATAPGDGPKPGEEAPLVPNLTTAPGSALSSSGSNLGAQAVSSAPLPIASNISAKADSQRLHAIFMTEESLDLPKTIRMVAELPGLRACLLNTTDGRKLAGNLDDANQEQAVSALIPELFQQARTKLASLRLGILETITLYCGRDQLSAFIEGNFCLTVLHDNRPFKPGVREKVQAVLHELVNLITCEKEREISDHADHQLRE